MEYRLAHMTQDEVGAVVRESRMVIVPTGATESHGPHMPTDTDSHQADHMAMKLAERVNAVVAPTLSYGISKTFERFSGTVSLSIPVYQEVLYEVGSALIKQGFKNLLILNGNRPNGTSNDAVARRLVDDLDESFDFTVTAVSYWEPAAAAIHAMRLSEVGGMGHGGEFETAFQLATRPELVKMDRIADIEPPLVGWDLSAPGNPNRTYGRRPDPADGHPSIFGAPKHATAGSGLRFIDAAVEGLVEMVENLQGSYQVRSDARG